MTVTGDETGKNAATGEDPTEERTAEPAGRPGGDREDGGSEQSGERAGTHAGGDASDVAEAYEEHPHGRGAKSGRKRSKKHRDRDLAELLNRKNEILQDLENRLAEAEQLTARYEDRLLRLAAEFENYKKRTRREWELHEKRANAELVKGLLHVLDDFNRALETSGEAGEHFREGIRLINTSLTEVLARNGLSEIDAMGKPFDPQFHEAVGEREAGDIEPGHVAEVLQRGYMFHDQVLRPTRVLVAKRTGDSSGAV